MCVKVSRFHLHKLILAAIMLAAASSLLSGCVAGPDYLRPDIAVAADWQARHPYRSKTADLASWWMTFRDPALVELINTAEASSPTLASASAKIAKARATLASSVSGLFPSASGTGSVTRALSESVGVPALTNTTSTGELDASWEIDLFGKVRRQNEADAARIGAAVDDWNDGRVSLAAEVADNYVQYKACRVLVRLYHDELASQQATQRATKSSADAGNAAPADLSLAQAGTASAASTLIEQGAQCDLLVKSLVVLTGLSEPDLRRVLARQGDHIPRPAAIAVTSVPASLLSQRPDIASLERELAARNAEIGVAEADRYPSLSLSGTISVSQVTGAGTLAPWSFGPALSMPIFDAGKREAAVDSAAASYKDARASYEKGVRNAVSDVEKALVRLDSARHRLVYARLAATNYRSYFDAADKNWRAGGISLLTLEEARRSAQTAETTLVGLKREEVQYWIALYKALGGGWPHISAAQRPEQSRQL